MHPPEILSREGAIPNLNNDMRNVFNQLKKWSVSAERLTLTPGVIEKLADHASIAIANEKLVEVYTFLYDVLGQKVSGFIAIPKTQSKPLPVVIFNRGGTGDYGLIPRGRLFTRIADIATWGYVVIGTQYPGNSLSEGLDERGGVSDLESILRLKSLINTLDVTDEEKIGMFGESRGGMMTYLSLKKVDWIKAAVTVGGLTNLQRSLELRPEMKQVFEASFGNTKKDIVDRSAVKWAGSFRQVPLCVIHGGEDDTVSPLDSLELATELQKNNLKYGLHIIAGGNHGLTNRSERRDAITRDWFDTYLKGVKNE